MENNLLICKFLFYPSIKGGDRVVNINTVIIKPFDVMNRKLWLLMTWLLVVPAFVQAASVRGVVVDYETNKPIANVKVAIRNVSAVTDFDGNFELKKVRRSEERRVGKECM